jgi:hypothetical protein
MTMPSNPDLAALVAARALLKKHEWPELTYDGDGIVVHWCRECGGYRPDDWDSRGPTNGWPADLRGHRPDCEAARVLATDGGDR